MAESAPVKHEPVYSNQLVSRQTYETRCSCGVAVTAQNKEDLRRKYELHRRQEGTS